jgi:hypothetical protein
MIYAIVLFIAYANVLLCAAFISPKMTLAAIILAAIETALAVYFIVTSKHDSSNSKSCTSCAPSNNRVTYVIPLGSSDSPDASDMDISQPEDTTIDPIASIKKATHGIKEVGNIDLQM